MGSTSNCDDVDQPPRGSISSTNAAGLGHSIVIHVPPCWWASSKSRISDYLCQCWMRSGCHPNGLPREIGSLWGCEANNVRGEEPHIQDGYNSLMEKEVLLPASRAWQEREPPRTVGRRPRKRSRRAVGDDIDDRRYGQSRQRHWRTWRCADGIQAPPLSSSSSAWKAFILSSRRSERDWPATFVSLFLPILTMVLTLVVIIVAVASNYTKRWMSTTRKSTPAEMVWNVFYGLENDVCGGKFVLLGLGSLARLPGGFHFHLNRISGSS